MFRYVGDKVTGDVDYAFQASIGDRVDNPPTLPLSVDKVTPSQAGEMVRNPALRHAGLLDKLADAVWSIEQVLDDG